MSVLEYISKGTGPNGADEVKQVSDLDPLPSSAVLNGNVTQNISAISSQAVVKAYLALAAGTGYSIGDFISEVQSYELDTDGGIRRDWYNLTTQAKLTVDPSADLQTAQEIKLIGGQVDYFEVTETHTCVVDPGTTFTAGSILRRTTFTAATIAEASTVDSWQGITQDGNVDVYYQIGLFPRVSKIKEYKFADIGLGSPVYETEVKYSSEGKFYLAIGTDVARYAIDDIIFHAYSNATNSFNPYSHIISAASGLEASSYNITNATQFGFALTAAELLADFVEYDHKKQPFSVIVQGTASATQSNAGNNLLSIPGGYKGIKYLRFENKDTAAKISIAIGSGFGEGIVSNLNTIDNIPTFGQGVVIAPGEVFEKTFENPVTININFGTDIVPSSANNLGVIIELVG